MQEDKPGHLSLADPVGRIVHTLVVLEVSYCKAQFKVQPSTSSSANLQDCLDIVATQGVYLVLRARIHMFEETRDGQFVATLYRNLRGFL